MSTDYSVVCDTCKEYRHLGQRMASTYSFGYGSKDRETPTEIMEWIAGHADQGHKLTILWSDAVPENCLDAEELAALKVALARSIEPSYVEQWMLEPNPMFGGRQPLQVMRDGHAELLWRMMDRLESGMPG
jgi:hypothetical protein